MRILHVSLADPFKHSGGLNAYCRDVITGQREQGMDVSVLFPGRLSLFKRHPRIRKVRKNIFRFDDSLPVPVSYGVRDPIPFLNGACSLALFSKFFANNHFDILHIHSIQGFPASFFEAAKESGAHLVFTTHDYYPICLRCTLINREGIYCNGPTPKKCLLCNKGAGLGRFVEYLYRSHLSFLFRSSLFVRFRKAVLRGKKDAEAESVISHFELGLYSDLLDMHRRIMSSMDLLLSNSFVSDSLYRKAFPELKIKMIGISNASIRLSPKRRSRHHPFRIVFAGGPNSIKGFGVLKAAVALLRSDDWELACYGSGFPATDNPKIKYLVPYSAKTAESVWREADLLVVPSVCPETFGFVVAEALLRGVPAIASSLVGSSFLLKTISDFLVVPPGDSEALASAIGRLMEKNTYEDLLEKIQETDFSSLLFDRHLNTLENEYLDLCK